MSHASGFLGPLTGEPKQGSSPLWGEEGTILCETGEKRGTNLHDPLSLPRQNGILRRMADQEEEEEEEWGFGRILLKQVGGTEQFQK